MPPPWEHIPRVFADLMALSGMPMEATFGMVYQNKTLDQVAAEEASKSLGVMGPDDELAGYASENAIDKAMYQLENPNSLMTPWGPTLDDQSVDMILMENPGIQDMVSLPPELRDSDARDADDLINNAGGWLDDFMQGVRENAMSLGQDVAQTGRDMFDSSMEMMEEVTRKTLATKAIESSMHPYNQIRNIGEAIFPVYTAEASHIPLVHRDEDGNIVPTEMTTGEEDLFEGGLAQPTLSTTPQLEELEGTSLLESALTGAQQVASGLTAIEQNILTDVNNPANPNYERHRINLELDEGLRPGVEGEVDPDYQPTDQVIFLNMVAALITGDYIVEDVQGWIDWHPEFETERPALYSSLVWITDNLKQGDPLMEASEYGAGLRANINWIDAMRWTTTQAIPTIHPGVSDAPVVGPDSGVTNKEIVSTVEDIFPNMLEVHGRGAVSETPEVEASYFKKFKEAVANTPNGKHGAVEGSIVNLYHDAHVIFAIHNAAKGGDATSLEAFENFLDRPVRGSPADPRREGYVWNPDMYTSVTAIDEQGHTLGDKVEKIQSALDAYYKNPGDALPQDFDNIVKIFAVDQFSEAKRDRLMQLYATNFDTGFASSKIHGTLKRMIANWRNDNRPEWEIINIMFKTPYQKAAPYLEDTEDEEDFASRAYMPQRQEAIDMRGPGRSMYSRTDPSLWTDPMDPKFISGTRGQLDPLTYSSTTDPIHRGMYFPSLDPAKMPAATSEPVPSLQERARGKQYAAENPFMAQVLQNKLDWDAMDRYNAMIGADDLGGGDIDHLASQVFTKPRTPEFGRGGPAFEGLSREHLLSMPEPFDALENEKRMAGRPYSTVLKIGGVIQKDEAGNPIRGTNFVPTDRWVPSG